MSQLLLGVGREVQPAVTGAPPFSPTDLAGLALWLKADAGTFTTNAMTTPATTDLSPVGGWADQSAGGRNYVTATSSQRPVLRTGIKNGWPILRFDGVDDRLQIGASGGFPGANFTIFIVHQTSGDGIFFGPLATNIQVRVGRSGANVLSLFDGSNEPVSTTIPVARTVWQIAEYQTGPHFWSSGVSLDAGGAIGSLTLEMLGILNNGALPLNGDIGEIIIYTTVLGTTDRQRVESYLTTRWVL